MFKKVSVKLFSLQLIGKDKALDIYIDFSQILQESKNACKSPKKFVKHLKIEAENHCLCLTLCLTQLCRFPAVRGQSNTCTEECLKNRRISSSWVCIIPSCNKLFHEEICNNGFRLEFKSDNNIQNSLRKG